ncbi:hypothetical protein SAMN06295974_3713 [Plantibacter flavus]|uniref:Uncharacterized protein n=1 Tax=Plantibacter flavus TaxID=150123 RepID=A0A3N2BLK6_9MICO|nr:hypothetical protein [Plantibacter flavus]ROR76139.1 hypothetical protein EDD42_4092 [Plantibacter flavus]SMG48321.1 hypothetical protein SAMN06295974_3713 [Plantibacter flavus]
MSDMDAAFIDGVRDTNEVFLEAEERALKWARRRSEMTRMAHRNGVSVEDIAAGVGQPPSIVREWLSAPTD